AALVHDNALNNTVIDTGFDTGDVDAAFAGAREIVEFIFTSRRQSAMPLEPRGAVAVFDPATGRVTLSVSGQSPHLIRTGVAGAPLPRRRRLDRGPTGKPDRVVSRP